MAKHNEVGTTGEKVAEEFLISKGHKILSRNYRKLYGELDVVSVFRGTVHFVEVKTVSHGTPSDDGTFDSFRPEENVHPQKIKRLLRTIESYILEKGIDAEWQFDVIAVFLDTKEKTARVRFLENVILGS